MRTALRPLLAVLLGAPHAARALQAGAGRFEPFAEENVGNGPPSSFVAGDGLACFEGQARIVEGALGLKKAGPRGSMYRGIYAKKNATCLSRGYSEVAYADACYPGLLRHFNTDAEHRRFQGVERGALVSFAQKFQVHPRRVELMNACSCHDQSEWHKLHGAECDSLYVHGSFLEHSPEGGAPLICHGGHYTATTRALATLKSSPNLPMHQNDLVVPMPCAAQGFRFRAEKYDNCFTDIHTWTKTSPSTGEDLGVHKASMTEQQLVQQSGFQAFAGRNGLDAEILDGIEGCQCSPGSKVGRQMGKLCWQPGASSPIRDWWTA